MKYIKLFETFKSKVITGTIKFLSNKLGINASNDFFNQIKKLEDVFDIRISEIDKDSIEYLRTANAINIKGQNVENDSGIYCLKYWFSIDGGYLATTCTGDLTTPYVEYNNLIDKNINFSSKQIKFIKRQLDIKTGLLTPVLDYNKLKTNDDIIVILSNIDSDPVYAKVVVSDGQVFAYQNQKSDGTTANYVPSEIKSEFLNCWRLSRYDSSDKEMSIDGDHYQLHKLDKTSESLTQKKIKQVKHSANLADFNKFFNGRYAEDWSKQNKYVINIIKKSDYAVIVYLDKILQNNDSVSDIKYKRKEIKKDATALLSDNSIREINFKRLLAKLILKYGIQKDNLDFDKLSKLINNFMSNKFIIFRIVYTGSGLIDDFIDILSKLVINKDENSLNKVINNFKRNRKNAEFYSSIFNGNLKKINMSSDNQLIEITNKIIQLGNKINNYLALSEIENIDDLIIIQYKINSIEKIIDDSRYKLAGYNSILQNFSSSNLEQYIELCKGISEESFNESMEKLGKIENYISSILK